MSEGTLKKWVESIAAKTHNDAIKTRASSIAHTIRKMGESGIVGSILGAVDAEVGLDQEGVPLDFVGAAAGSAAAVFFSDAEFSDDISNAGASCMSVFSFRKTKELVKRISGTKVAGDDDEVGDESDVGEEDPVVRAAREL